MVDQATRPCPAAADCPASRRPPAAAAAAGPRGCGRAAARCSGGAGAGFATVFGLGLGFGLGSSGCGGNRLRLGRRLIAFDQLLRHALRHARRPLGKHRPAVALQLLLGVEHVGAEELGRVEAFAARKHKPQRQRRSDNSDTSEAVHGCAPQLLLSAAVSAISISTRERVAAGVCASVVIMSNQRLAALVSPARQAASASSSRAVWRKVRSGPVSGSSSRRA